jgi:hypothetical protein
MNSNWERIRVLITVKTYPIPSSKYDELVCTAGVQEDGTFVRLYPINFRDLSYSQQYKKYQWIEAEVQKHTGRDVRKESYRPNSDTIKLLGEPIPTKAGDWSERARFALAKRSASMEDLYAQQEADKTSLGVFRPKKVHDLDVTSDDPDWKPGFRAALAQARLWENRTVSQEPPRKVPFKFRFLFECDDPICKRSHRMMIEDWEVGALFWKCVDAGATHQEACQRVKQKFLDQICAADRDTHFYVGTLLAYPKTWVVIGLFWPKVQTDSADPQLQLFEV